MVLLMTCRFSYAQLDVTKFLGIPVDGTKAEMIPKLMAKGFTPHKYGETDYMSGEFNGSQVHLFIKTNNGKVYRIMVSEIQTFDEGDIRIRFNNLYQQFKKNPNYITLKDSNNYMIPQTEDISYEMQMHSKRYEAVFFQKATISSEENARIVDEAMKHITLTTDDGKPMTAEQIDAVRDALSKTMLPYFEEMSASKKIVWFRISEHYGKYFLSIYYDNEYNKADGEDL